MIGWKNKFRFITWGPQRCAQCGADCNLFRPEDMAPEPVTLRVVLYGKEYNVTYPSQDRVDDLTVEFNVQGREEATWKSKVLRLYPLWFRSFL